MQTDKPHHSDSFTNPWQTNKKNCIEIAVNLFSPSFEFDSVCLRSHDYVKIISKKNNTYVAFENRCSAEFENILNALVVSL